MVWLSGLSTILWTKRSLVRFPVRAHACVAGQVPSGGRARGNHTLMFLSLSLSFSSPLKINKIFTIYIHIYIHTHTHTHTHIYIYIFAQVLLFISQHKWVFLKKDSSIQLHILKKTVHEMREKIGGWKHRSSFTWRPSIIKEQIMLLA